MPDYKWSEARVDDRWEMEDCYFERRGPICRFTLNRPEKRNAYTANMYEGLTRAKDQIKEDMTVRALIITGEGDKAFCAGPSFVDRGFSKEMQEKGESNLFVGYWGRERRTFYCKQLKQLLQDLYVPTIARLNGLAVGAGMDWALACDMIVAAEHAYVGQWYGRRGLVTDRGGAWYLTRLMPANKVKELVFTARTLTAKEAEAVGIVNRTVPNEKLDEAIDELMNEILMCSPQAVRWDKELINKALTMDYDDWAEFMAFPCMVQFQTHDGQEGFQAFREKREPSWEGR
jgi:2-(1,2-epoxy-1,2-dihydrophenyl)acetyl-CoA isomerase